MELKKSFKRKKYKVINNINYKYFIFDLNNNIFNYLYILYFFLKICRIIEIYLYKNLNIVFLIFNFKLEINNIKRIDYILKLNYIINN